MMTTHAIATTKAARHQKIVELLSRHPVHSQAELADLLATSGLRVTQGTLSRDLVDLEAVRVRDSSRSARVCRPERGRRPNPEVGDRLGRGRESAGQALRTS